MVVGTPLVLVYSIGLALLCTLWVLYSSLFFFLSHDDHGRFYRHGIFNKSLSMAKAKAFRLFLVFFTADVIVFWLSPYLYSLYSLGFQIQVTTG